MIFVDTGAFIARWLPNDQEHRRASAGWKGLDETPRRLFTSHFVVNETLTLLSRRTTHEFALQRVKNIYLSTSMTILRSTREDEIEALDLFHKYTGLRVSFTDCLSFVHMRKNRIERAFTFDGHFESVGFQRWPSVA